MSKTRKILSLVIAVAMLISVFAVSAFAYTPTDVDRNGNAYTQTWALSEARDNGNGTWSVDVSLTTNYKVGPIEFTVENTNNSGVVLSGAALGAAVPAAWNAEINYYNSTGRVMIIPSTAGKNTLDGAVMSGVIATLTYTVADGASADINIKNDPKGDGADIGGTLIAARAGDIISDKAVYGQTVLSVGETRHIGGGSAAAPELAVIEGTGGYIDTTRTELVMEDGTEYTVDGVIYGVEVVDQGETISDVFEVIGDGSMQIIENDAGSDCGTGVTVNVLDNDGNIVATYKFVLFGDLDGDGEIGLGDSALIEAHDGYSYDEDDGRIGDSLLLLAGDLDADEEVGLGDSALIEAHDGYSFDEDDGRMSQADIVALYRS